MHRPASRIGPNAILQIASVLQDRHGRGGVERVFGRAGLAHYLDTPPTAMVAEREVARLHVALARELGSSDAEAVAREAGERTALYILAHRIPGPAKRVLRLLPPRLASRLLLAAIRKHAWTFAGSAAFRASAGPPVDLSLAGCAMCRANLAGGRLPAFYAATFEGLFRALVARRAHITPPGPGWPVTWTARIDWRAR
jgi:divinyl protochlorophyllide a 8-vinyl-reductase